MFASFWLFKFSSFSLVRAQHNLRKQSNYYIASNCEIVRLTYLHLADTLFQASSVKRIFPCLCCNTSSACVWMAPGFSLQESNAITTVKIAPEIVSPLGNFLARKFLLTQTQPKALILRDTFSNVYANFMQHVPSSELWQNKD